jgi:aminopeptidase N
LNSTGPNDWILANLEHAGWYRVNYNKSNWMLLIQQLNDDHEILSRNARAQLIDDSFNLGRAELIDQTVFLDISKYLSKETSPLAFRPAFVAWSEMEKLISDDLVTYGRFKVI